MSLGFTNGLKKEWIGTVAGEVDRMIVEKDGEYVESTVWSVVHNKWNKEGMDRNCGWRGGYTVMIVEKYGE